MTHPIQSFAVGMEGSPDIVAARKVSLYVVSILLRDTSILSYGVFDVIIQYFNKLDVFHIYTFLHFSLNNVF